MKFALASARLLAAAACVGLLGAGCGHHEDRPTASVSAGGNADEAIATVQNDQSKSPEEKVKEIDAIQRQYSQDKPTQTRKHRKEE